MIYTVTFADPKYQEYVVSHTITGEVEEKNMIMHFLNIYANHLFENCHVKKRIIFPITDYNDYCQVFTDKRNDLLTTSEFDYKHDPIIIQYINDAGECIKFCHRGYIRSITVLCDRMIAKIDSI
jgi:hypothetical protein